MGSSFLGLCRAAGLIGDSQGGSAWSSGVPLPELKARVSHLARQAGLDCPEAWKVYVDCDYRVRYVSPPLARASWKLNRKRQERDLNNALGKRCYEAFRGRDTPCPDCVLKEAGEMATMLSRIAWEGWGGPTHTYTIPEFESASCPGRSPRFLGILEIGFPVTQEVVERECADFQALVGEEPPPSMLEQSACRIMTEAGADLECN